MRTWGFGECSSYRREFNFSSSVLQAAKNLTIAGARHFHTSCEEEGQVYFSPTESKSLMLSDGKDIIESYYTTKIIEYIQLGM